VVDLEAVATAHHEEEDIVADTAAVEEDPDTAPTRTPALQP
jgi:hypothetical protein